MSEVDRGREEGARGKPVGQVDRGHVDGPIGGVELVFRRDDRARWKAALERRVVKPERRERERFGCFRERFADYRFNFCPDYDESIARVKGFRSWSGDERIVLELADTRTYRG